MKQQTAVDMFCLSITDHIEGIFNGSIQQDEFAKRMRESYNQAKAMEKEQSLDFAKHCLDKAKDLDVRTAFFNVEKYFNKTYKNQKP